MLFCPSAESVNFCSSELGPWVCGLWLWRAFGPCNERAASFCCQLFIVVCTVKQEYFVAVAAGELISFAHLARILDFLPRG